MYIRVYVCSYINPWTLEYLFTIGNSNIGGCSNNNWKETIQRLLYTHMYALTHTHICRLGSLYTCPFSKLLLHVTASASSEGDPEDAETAQAAPGERGNVAGSVRNSCIKDVVQKWIQRPKKLLDQTRHVPIHIHVRVFLIEAHP